MSQTRDTKMRSATMTIFPQDGQTLEGLQDQVINYSNSSYAIAGIETCPDTGRQHLQCKSPHSSSLPIDIPGATAANPIDLSADDDDMEEDDANCPECNRWICECAINCSICDEDPCSCLNLSGIPEKKRVILENCGPIIESYSGVHFHRNGVSIGPNYWSNDAWKDIYRHFSNRNASSFLTSFPTGWTKDDL